MYCIKKILREYVHLLVHPTVLSALQQLMRENSLEGTAQNQVRGLDSFYVLNA